MAKKKKKKKKVFGWLGAKIRVFMRQAIRIFYEWPSRAVFTLHASTEGRQVRRVDAAGRDGTAGREGGGITSMKRCVVRWGSLYDWCCAMSESAVRVERGNYIPSRT